MKVKHNPKAILVFLFLSSLFIHMCIRISWFCFPQPGLGSKLRIWTKIWNFVNKLFIETLKVCHLAIKVDHGPRECAIIAWWTTVVFGEGGATLSAEKPPKKFNWCEAEFSAAGGLLLIVRLQKDSEFRSFKFIIYTESGSILQLLPRWVLSYEMRSNILEHSLSPMDHMIALLHPPLHTFTGWKLVSQCELWYDRERAEEHWWLTV